MLIPNQWYAVMESKEVKSGGPVAFKRLGQELVFWRDSAGQIAVAEDRCPHRQAKLSLGKVVDGCIECPFHGFRYDSEGTCQLIPANGKNGPRPKIFQLASYPVQEAHGFVWVWYGEARDEYPAIPFFVEETAGFTYGTLRREWPTDYSRAIENQLDVAHLPFVHFDSIGRGGRTLVNGPYTLLENDAIYVWVNNIADEGQLPAKPSELTQPDRPWSLCFKYPNVWMLQPTPKLKIMVAFAPVDDENTVMYVRFYHDFVKQPLLRKLIAQAGAYGNRKVLLQDENVVFSQRPKQGGLDSGDKYIPADRPVLLYYTHRDELIQAAQNEQETELKSVADYVASGQKIAG